MHAVRVLEEAKELLISGIITFPRPEKARLLKIRQGLLSYQEVAESLESGIEDIESLQQKSQLPNEIDHNFWHQWLMEVYWKAVNSRVGINKPSQVYE
jgi:hypothetical protein